MLELDSDQRFIFVFLLGISIFFAIFIYILVHQVEIDAPIKREIAQAIKDRDCIKYEELLIEYGYLLNYKMSFQVGENFYEIRCK